jgi:hypothetical protein
MYAAASPFWLLHICGCYNVFQSKHHVRCNNLPGEVV